MRKKIAIYICILFFTNTILGVASTLLGGGETCVYNSKKLEGGGET